MDLNGKKLRTQQIGNSTQFSIEEFKSGTYIFLIEKDDQIIKVERIVKN